MPMITCKVEILLKRIENCVLTTAAVVANANATGADSATFEITDTKLSVPVVNLSAEDSAKLAKELDEGFKRPVYWNKYKVIPHKQGTVNANIEKPIRELLDSTYEGVQRLFVLAYNNTNDNVNRDADSFKKYFLARVKIENYKIEIDGRNFYDQPINDLIKQHKVRKVSTGQGDD